MFPYFLTEKQKTLAEDILFEEYSEVIEDQEITIFVFDATEIAKHYNGFLRFKYDKEFIEDIEKKFNVNCDNVFSLPRKHYYLFQIDDLYFRSMKIALMDKESFTMLKLES